MGFSGHDPNIFESGDSSSDDDETPPIPLDQMNSPAVDETMLNMINEGVEARINKKRPRTSSEPGPSQKKKKKAKADDRIAGASSNLEGLKPLIKESVDTIARALGESEDFNVMRMDLLQNLEKMEGLTRGQMIIAMRRFLNNPGDLKCFYELEKEEDKLTLVLDLLSK